MDSARLANRLFAWFPLLLLAGLAALTYWLDQTVQPPPVAAGGPPRHDPDFIAQRFSAVRLGTDGRPGYEVFGERLVHYPDDETTHVDLPRVIRNEPGKAPISMTANRGLIAGEGDDVYLMDNVKVVRAAFGRESEAVMTTSYLHVIPAQDLARTDKPVRIQDANTVLDGVGLEFNSKTRVATLNQVKGRYEDPRSR